MKTTKVSKSIAVRGVVERCDLKKRAPFDPYISRYDSLPTERNDVYLDVAVRLPDGSAVYFTTPAARETITCCPGAAVVTYCVERGSAEWMEEVDGSGVATPGKPNTNSIRPTLRVGDTLTVAGTLKTEKVSKYGKPYKVINRVYKPTDEGLANFPSEKKFGF